MTEETETPARVRKTNRTQAAIVGLIVLLVVGTQIFSQRPRWLTSRPWVVHVADIPEAQRDAVESIYWSNQQVAIPSTTYRPPIGIPAAPVDGPDSPVKLGYSIREVSLLGMPMMAYSDAGEVLYAETPGNFRMTQFDADARTMLDAAGGQAIGRDYSFPWWAYLWGWLLPVLIVTWGVVWWRSAKREREESGLL